MLAPLRHKKFLSWFTGWLTFAGWTGNAAATASFFGALVLTAYQIAHPTYAPDAATTNWQTTLIAIAALSLAFVFNTAFTTTLPTLGKVLLFIQAAVILGLIIPLCAKAEHLPAYDVFVHYSITSGWNSKGMAFMIGLSSSNVALIGVDVPTHFGEYS